MADERTERQKVQEITDKLHNKIQKGSCRFTNFYSLKRQHLFGKLNSSLHTGRKSGWHSESFSHLLQVWDNNLWHA